MIIRATGVVLLAMGFVALAAAALMRDPTALDANIGAGGLTLVGIPMGTIGLVMTIGAVAYDAWSRRRRGRGRAGDDRI